MKKEGNTKGAGVKSGLSERTGFKGGPDHVSQQKDKNQVPYRKKEKVGKFTIA